MASKYSSGSSHPGTHSPITCNCKVYAHTTGNISMTMHPHAQVREQTLLLQWGACLPSLNT